MTRFILVAVLGLLALSAQAQTQRLRGEVVRVQGQELALKTDSGQAMTVTLAKDASVVMLSRLDRSAIKPGVFLGTAAVPQSDGTLLASEIHVFPESLRGLGEGHRPMPALPGSTMTNATVTNVTMGRAPRASGTETNATVATVAGAQGSQRMTLKYKDGEKVVVIPDSAPVVLFERGNATMITAGAKVYVTVTRRPDGTFSAERISVGKGGLVPPI